MARPSKPEAEPAPTAKSDLAGRDLVLVHGRAPDGTLHVLRQRDGRVEAGAMRAVEEGKPLTGELVKLSPRAELPLLFDAETVYRAPEAAAPGPAAASAALPAATDGPAQVANEAYRKNWSRIFGAAKRRASSELPN